MFKTKNTPKIYAYTDTRFPGYIKVGYTTKDTAEQRVRQQMENVKLPKQSWEIILEEIAIREDGSFFTDGAVHRQLQKMGIINKKEEGEWFQCTLNEVKAAILAEKRQEFNKEKRSLDFGMRPEQQEAVTKTAKYFRSFEKEKGIIPHFLWNAKMRFGKTFASYQLALEMGWTKILVLTFKPAVLSAWREDLLSHIDFKKWQFVSKKEEDISEGEINHNQPFVYFASLQDVLGRDKKSGGIKISNEWVHNTDWDCVIFDEYHFGAWQDNTKDLFDAKKNKEEKEEYEQTLKEQKEIETENDGKALDFQFEEDELPITTKHYLYLSGTPFRAIANGEFIEEQIFNWTYTDEQKAKTEWNEKNGANPYASLPRLVMLTYQLPEDIRNIALKGEFNEFDLNEFFSTTDTGKNATFKYEEEVQNWLEFVRGQYKEKNEDALKDPKNKAPMPFKDVRLKDALQHSFWFLPNVASCFAMANLLKKTTNKFFHDYEVVVCAGTQAGIGVEALKPLEAAMTREPLKTKTITLSCGKLTTGVSVKPWTGIFILRNTQSPETYFQTVFRVQTPWVLKNPDKNSPNREEIIKHECYVFDFAPNRALSQIVSYSNRLNVDSNESPEKKVADLLSFLPVLSYDGSVMKEINASELLDIATSGTTGTLLARRWESALLVNVDNITLQRLLNNEEAMKALMSIEGFRSLNQDIESIVNKSEEIKQTKKEAAEKDEELSKTEKKELTDKEKEVKSMRKQIQEKLIKFATRLPVFMYLSELREHTLKDVIQYIEPELFKKVTGLSIEDFSLLESLGVFNGELMNDAVFKFKRYEDSSLEYTGINKHSEDAYIGGYDTVTQNRVIGAVE